VPHELAIDLFQVAANRLEDLRQGWGFFHGRSRKLYHGRKRL
jgi:hypothetical protein